MKTTIPLYLTLATALPVLFACNSSGGVDNEAPTIELVHPMVIVQPFDVDDEIEMDLRMLVVVNDLNGFSDLDTATISFPAGQSYDIDLSERLFEHNGETGFIASFSLADVAAGSNGKELLMTGYKVTLTDMAGLSDEESVDLLGFDGVEVPMGTYLVHPDDFPVSSGGDYIEGMAMPTVDSSSITVNSSTVSLDITIDDSRAYDLTINLYDANDDLIARTYITGPENLTLSGKGSYSIPVADFDFEEGHNINDATKLRVYVGDEGLYKSGFTAGVSHQLGESIKYSL